MGHSNGLLGHSAFGSFFGLELFSAVKDNGLGRHPPDHVEATGVLGREMMLGRPPRLDVASQHGMITKACVLLAQEIIFSRDIVAVAFEAGASQLKTDQAGLRRQPFPASDGMRVRCLDVSVKFYLKVKLLQREEQPLAPMASREPSKRVRNARRASERAKESDIDRSSFYL